MRHLRFSAICVFLLLCFAPLSARAQSDQWSELRTARFAILYGAGDDQTAQEYAGFVDTIYDEVAAVFGHQTGTPITLRLFPTLESYYVVNPLARGLPGIVAHADYRRHEVVVILPQTKSQTKDEVQNNVRHELTHIVAADLSEDRLNVLFQEGLAQYVEHPSRELETKVQLLQSAASQNRLLPWSDLDDRETFYRNAQISYPESLSVVAFLVEKYTFAKFRDFVGLAGRSSGYRSALERAFGIPADTLERDWRAWLPDYLAGGYRRNALTAYDLSQAEALLKGGRYADAQKELEGAIKWLGTTKQADGLQKAQELLEQSIAGQRAESLAGDARAALAAGDYARAADLVAQAQQAFEQVGDARAGALLADYAARAARGQSASKTIDEAEALAQTLRYPQARSLADRAASEFAALGAGERVQQAQALRATLDQRQSLFGAILLALGGVGIAVSAWRLLAVREVEAW